MVAPMTTLLLGVSFAMIVAGAVITAVTPSAASVVLIIAAAYLAA